MKASSAGETAFYRSARCNSIETPIAATEAAWLNRKKRKITKRGQRAKYRGPPTRTEIQSTGEPLSPEQLRTIA
jgi:hypothetical protein